MRHALALMVQKLRAVWPTTLKSRFAWAFFASAVSVTLVVLFTPASAGPVETGGNWLITGLAQIMLAMANLAIGLCLFFLRFFIAIASYNNYIDVDVVQLGWVMVRDVANMFFVVALLVIAFGTILGLEEYEWKKNLVKLIFAAIFINFSNLIAQLFIDVAHVFTMTFLNAISATSSGNLINMFRLDQITQMVGVKPDVNTEFNVEILAGTAVAALFAVLAAFIMGSYVYVMMARVVALWALIILSPLAYILGVLPKTQSYAERWWSEFTNHVIVAPIMVFFMWLAFATLGTGNILASIQEDIPSANKIDGTKSVQLIGANFVDSNEPTKLSLSKVSTWENMANFLIALAFLRVGVKTTEETGVWGTDMISDAWEFGKKAATIATGYAAGRWLMDRGTDTLKTGASALAYRVPLVGGRALTNYGNMAKLQLGKVGIWRDNKAKKLEEVEKELRKNEQLYKMGVDKGGISKDEFLRKKAELHEKAGGYLGRGLRTLGASLIQTNGRADKKAEDWQKAVEAQKSYIEENYSTSDSAGGRVKLQWGILAHKAEEMAHAKKDQKYAEGEEFMLAEEGKRAGGYLTTLEDTAAKAKAAAEASKDRLAEHSEKQLEEKRRGAGVYKAKAEREQTMFELGEKRDVEQAIARDKLLAKAGRFSEAINLQNVLDRQAKARVDRQGSSDYPVSLQRTLNLMDQMKNTQSAEELEKLKKSFTEMGIANFSRHYGIGGGVQGAVLGAFGEGFDKSTSMDIDKEKIENIQKKLFSYLLNEPVESAADGLKKFSELHGDDTQAMLEQLRRATEKSAGEGSISLAGLFKTVVNKDGSSTVSLTDGGDEKDIKYINARRTNALSSASIARISGGGLGGSVDRDSEGKIKIDSSSSIEVLAKMITPLTGNNLGSVDEFTKGDLADIFKNSSGDSLRKLREKITKMDERGRKGLVGFIRERLSEEEQQKIETVLRSFEN